MAEEWFQLAQAGKIFALDWRDVDLAAGLVRVRESKMEAGQRRVPILEPLLPLLKAESLRQGRPEEVAS